MEEQEKYEANKCVGCDYYDDEEDVCMAFICDGIECPSLPCEQKETIYGLY